MELLFDVVQCFCICTNLSNIAKCQTLFFCLEKIRKKESQESHLEGFFGQQLIIKRQELTNIASFDELSQIQYHLDSLGHIAIPQGQLEIRDQIVLLLLANLHPYAYKAGVE